MPFDELVGKACMGLHLHTGGMDVKMGVTEGFTYT
jgi:hypothetical protein